MEPRLSEEHRLLREMAQRFFKERMPVDHLRALRDREDPIGFDRALWAEMGQLGLSGLLIEDTYGGAGLDLLAMGLVMEEAGRTLAATPLFSTGVLASRLLTLGGNDELKKTFLPPIAEGKTVGALAFEEGNHHNPSHITTRGEKNTLTGHKTLVIDGAAADFFIVAARTDGAPEDKDGITLFLVNASSPGVKCIRTAMVDSRAYGDLHLDKAHAEAVLGEDGKGYPLLRAALDWGRIALASEMLGSAREVFERTVDYLKERHQFDVPLSSFQALQHRAAQMFCALEMTQCVVSEALEAGDSQDTVSLAALASLAKTKAGELARLVTAEGIQLHGGLGMTDEADLGLFFKRARVQSHLLGDSAFHRDRYATLHKY